MVIVAQLVMAIAFMNETWVRSDLSLSAVGSWRRFTHGVVRLGLPVASRRARSDRNSSRLRSKVNRDPSF